MNEQIPADDRLALAQAMGLEATADTSGGYGTVRVVLSSGKVFLPETDHFAHVAAWLHGIESPAEHTRAVVEQAVSKARGA